METITPSKLKVIRTIDSVFKILVPKKRNQNTNIELDKIKKIIVLDPTALGDMIMLIPFLNVLRNNFKKAEITLVCASHGLKILKPLNIIDNFITFNGNSSFLGLKNLCKDRKHLKDTLKKINENNYDIAIEPRGDIRYIFFMSKFKSKYKISYSYSGGEYLLTHSYKMPDNYKSTHLIEDKIHLLELIGCKAEAKDYYPYLPKDTILKKDFIKTHNLKKYKLIGIHPGASKEIRQYPFYDKIVENINNKNLCFLIFKGYNEDNAVEKIEKKLKELNAKYYIISENLEKYIRLLSICDIVLCNDSGAGHISGAYGIKTYVFFGPEKPEGVRPYNEKNVKYINHNIDCKPCYCLQCPKEEQYCFSKINLEQVCNEIKKDIGNKTEVNYNEY